MIMAAPPVVMAYGEVKQHVTRAQPVLKYQGHHFLTDQADDNDENLFFAELVSPSEKDSIS